MNECKMLTVDQAGLCHRGLPQLSCWDSRHTLPHQAMNGYELRIRATSQRKFSQVLSSRQGLETPRIQGAHDDTV